MLPLSYLRNYPLGFLPPPRVSFIAPYPAVMPDYVLTCEILRVTALFLSVGCHGGEISRRCPEKKREKNARENAEGKAIPFGNFNTWKRRYLGRKPQARLAWNLNSGRLTLRTECAVKRALDVCSGTRPYITLQVRRTSARMLCRRAS